MFPNLKNWSRSASSRYRLPVRTPEKASFGRRFAAITIDWLLCSAVLGSFRHLSFESVQGLRLALFFAEISIFTILIQGSAGQRILGLRVVDSETGGAVSVPRILVRSLLICLILPAIFTHEGRGYHEQFTRTTVLR